MSSIVEEADDQVDKTQASNQTAANRSATKDNSLISSKHQKEKDSKKDKKKKRTKSSNQDDVNHLQILNSTDNDNRVLYKINSQTKSNQHLNNDFLLESMKLINEPTDRKSNQMNHSDGLNDEKVPLVWISLRAEFSSHRHV